MKIKQYLKLLFNISKILVVLSFIGCTIDHENFNENLSELNKSVKAKNFLDYHYNDGYEIIRQIEIFHEYSGYIIKEIKTKNNENRVGYIALGSENGEPYYFIDLDKNRMELVAVNFSNYDYVILNSFNSDLDKKIAKIDILKEIQNFNTNPEDRTFWGWECGTEYSIEPGSCWVTCCYYVLWISTGCDIYNCNSAPGNN